MAKAFLDALCRELDGRLLQFFERKLACTRALAPEAVVLVECLRDLTMRGGKRLRPAMLFAGARAVGAGGLELYSPAMALELLQTYLLVQDDWMDRDEVRRGGPAVHAVLRARFADRHLADSAAILASDLASAYAEELMAGGAPAAYAEMHQEVVLGQFLDLTGQGEVETVHLLKTASYTVRRPLRIGALLGGASEAQLAALDAFAVPLGIAFQLTDDALGTFGDSSKTGKASANDLREGKRTALVVEARRRLADSRVLDRAVGADEAAVRAAAAAIEDCGARAAVEARARALLAEGLAALEVEVLDPAGRTLLVDLARMLVERAA